MKLKIDSVFYLLKEGVKNIFNNGITSLASTVVLTCCLFLTGTVVLLSMSVNKALNTIKSKNIITVFLKSEILEEDSQKIENRINEIPNIASCKFYSKEEAIKKYDKSLGSLADGLKGSDNPLPNAFHVELKDLTKYDETFNSLKNVEGVESIGDRKQVTERLAKTDEIIKLAGIAIVIIFSALTLFVIHNTVRVTMYSRRLEISIMKSVGATDTFVRVPFIVEGVLIGFVSALVSTILLKLLSNIISDILKKLIPFTTIVFEGMNSSMVLIFLMSGVLTGFIGGIISIRKYLKKEGGRAIAI